MSRVPVLIVSAVLLVLAAAPVAFAAPPALDLVPSSAVEVVALDLSTDAPEARSLGLHYLRADAGFASFSKLVARSQLLAQMTGAVMVVDGLGRRAFVVEFDSPSASHLRTLRALIRAQGLADTAVKVRRGALARARWSPVSGPPLPGEDQASTMSMLDLDAGHRWVVGDLAVVDAVAGRLKSGRRAKLSPALLDVDADEVSTSVMWYASVDAQAPDGSAVATRMNLSLGGGSALVVVLEARTEADAQQLAAAIEADLRSPVRATEFNQLGLPSGLVNEVVVSSVQQQVHVILTLSAHEAEVSLGALARAIEQRAP